MKRKQLRPLSGCLKINSRKNRVVIAGFTFFRMSVFFIVLLFLFPLHLHALETILNVHASPEKVMVTAKAEYHEGDKVISSLEEGLTAEIVFQFRVYNINRGIFSIFGDRLVFEKKISYIAFKDFFINQYVIQTDDSRFIYYDTTGDFITGFTTLSDYLLIDAHSINLNEYYILARISITPVKLEPPLHIIALFSSIGRTSGWVEYRFTKDQE